MLIHRKQDLQRKLEPNVKWISDIAIHNSGDHVIVGDFSTRLAWIDTGFLVSFFVDLYFVFKIYHRNHSKLSDITRKRFVVANFTTSIRYSVLAQTTGLLLSHMDEFITTLHRSR